MRHKLNEKKQFTIGAKFLHINPDKSLEKTFNLLSKIHGDYRIRVFGLSFFAGLSLNYFLSDKPLFFDNLITFWKKDESNWNHQLWLGYTFGLEL